MNLHFGFSISFFGFKKEINADPTTCLHLISKCTMMNVKAIHCCIRFVSIPTSRPIENQLTKHHHFPLAPKLVSKSSDLCSSFCYTMMASAVPLDKMRTTQMHCSFDDFSNKLLPRPTNRGEHEVAPIYNNDNGLWR